MAIAFVDGAANWGSSSPFTLAIPADVAAGNIVIVYASVFSNNTQITLTGSVNTPTQLYFSYNGTNDSFMAWAFTAQAADAGATLTFTEVGASTYIGAAILAYSGAGMPLATTAYANGGYSTVAGTTWTAPSISGGSPVAGCWGIYCISAGVGSGDGGATYSGGTLREQTTAAGINAFDSNGSLGSAGSAVGGGTYTTQANGFNVGVTLALPPAGSGATVSGAVAPSALAAPAGSVAASETVAGPVATETLAAPAGSVSGGIVVAGPVAPIALAAPAGAVGGGASVAGPAAAQALAAAAGSVSASSRVTGVVAGEALAAPAGTVGPAVVAQQGTVSISNVLAATVSVGNALAGSVTIVNTI